MFRVIIEETELGFAGLLIKWDPYRIILKQISLAQVYRRVISGRSMITLLMTTLSDLNAIWGVANKPGHTDYPNDRSFRNFGW